MSLLLLKNAGILLTFVAALVPSLLLLLRRYNLGTLEHFWLEIAASGIFMAVACFDLLLDSYRSLMLTTLQSPLLWILLVLLPTLLVLQLLERSNQHLNSCNRHSQWLITMAFILMLFTHGFLEGLSVGTNQEWVTSVLLLSAIVAHKAFDVLALALHLVRRYPRALRMNVCLLILCAMMTPLGIGLGNHLLSNRLPPFFTPLINCLCAATLIHISLFHLLIPNWITADKKIKRKIILIFTASTAIPAGLCLWLG